MNAEVLLIKAERAMTSARLLLEAGDFDGACNRAYYAMFDAARAALISVGPWQAGEIPRTHSGLISAFSMHLVKAGRVSVELGRDLNKAEEIRLIADYTGDPVEQEVAERLVGQGEIFVTTINHLCRSTEQRLSS
jgi:uncharacterized protein (UPF0332 family)